MKAAGWFVATLLFFCSFCLGQEQQQPDPVQALYSKYSNLSFQQLLGEYNTVVGYHDELRSKFEYSLPEDAYKKAIIKQDDNWCQQRQEAWEAAVSHENRQELITIIVLEYLHCGTMQEKLLDGSSSGSHNLWQKH